MSSGAPGAQGFIEIDDGASFAGCIVHTPIALVTAVPKARITSFDGAVLHAELMVGPGIDLRECTFGDAVGLERLRFSEVSFAKVNRRFATFDESEHAYRQLRQAAEASRLFHVAADFHIGELQLRARSCEPLAAFGWMLYGAIGGYGHRPSRPIAWWFAMCGLITFLIITWPQRYVGGNFQLGGAYIDVAHWHVVFFRFVTRNALAVFSPIEYGDIHSDGFALFLIAKIGTMVLMILAGMGIRSRLRR